MKEGDWLRAAALEAGPTQTQHPEQEGHRAPSVAWFSQRRVLLQGGSARQAPEKEADSPGSPFWNDLFLLRGPAQSTGQDLRLEPPASHPSTQPCMGPPSKAAFEAQGTISTRPHTPTPSSRLPSPPPAWPCSHARPQGTQISRQPRGSALIAFKNMRKPQRLATSHLLGH